MSYVEVIVDQVSKTPTFPTRTYILFIYTLKISKYFLKFQTSNLGSASATAGGVGQRSVSIVVQAQKTIQYRSTAAIYGQ